MFPDPINTDFGEFVAGVEVLDPGSFVVCHISTTTGAGGVTLWHSSEIEVDSSAHCKLQLSPDRPAIIGRPCGGAAVPYLDPTYRATRLVPGTGQDIMQSDGHGGDRCVSRAHFMLRAGGRGVLLVNGVPQLGGGLRAPLCGTRLMAPEQRPMSAGEEFLVESGATAVIGLPNGVRVQISPQ